VEVFETDAKGSGLRAKIDFAPKAFIEEYVGEVIGIGDWNCRDIQYKKEGILHSYSMFLGGKHEVIDATKKGNLSRFINHSCNPNCLAEKWTVGARLRIGFFATRKIVAGEEITFNYDLGGRAADLRKCCCGESKCTGAMRIPPSSTYSTNKVTTLSGGEPSCIKVRQRRSARAQRSIRTYKNSASVVKEPIKTQTERQATTVAVKPSASSLYGNTRVEENRASHTSRRHSLHNRITPLKADMSRKLYQIEEDRMMKERSETSHNTVLSNTTIYDNALKQRLKDRRSSRARRPTAKLVC
jgi:hypothetical protein